jgi:hypothetical protein
VPRLDNQYVNHLAWITSSRALTPPDVIVEKLSKPLVKTTVSREEAVKHDMMVIDDPEQEPMCDWMHPVKMFLEN